VAPTLPATLQGAAAARCLHPSPTQRSGGRLARPLQPPHCFQATAAGEVGRGRVGADILSVNTGGYHPLSRPRPVPVTMSIQPDFPECVAQRRRGRSRRRVARPQSGREFSCKLRLMTAAFTVNASLPASVLCSSASAGFEAA
jgi:hypothetical protein